MLCLMGSIFPLQSYCNMSRGGIFWISSFRSPMRLLYSVLIGSIQSIPPCAHSPVHVCVVHVRGITGVVVVESREHPHSIDREIIKIREYFISWKIIEKMGTICPHKNKSVSLLESSNLDPIGGSEGYHPIESIYCDPTIHLWICWSSKIIIS